MKTITVDKDNAYGDFMRVIKKSWTWERLTDTERNNFISVADEFIQHRLIGTYHQRLEQMNTCYRAFLSALGYMPIGWRDEV